MRSVSGDSKDTSCDFIKTVTGFRYPLNGGYEGDLTEIRNKIANSGGSAYFILDKSTEDKGSGITHYHLTAEALACDFK